MNTNRSVVVSPSKDLEQVASNLHEHMLSPEVLSEAELAVILDESEETCELSSAPKTAAVQQS